MKRRRFLGVMAGAAALGSVGECAWAAGKMPVVGIIAGGTPESHGKWVAAFTRRMTELGWIDRQNIDLEYRWAAGRTDVLAGIAAELAGLGTDVFVTSTNLAVEAVRLAAPATPIVHVSINTGAPFIASLAHPGGMVTGLSQMGPELGRKRFQILQEILPDLRRLAILGIEGGTNTSLETDIVTQAARLAGVDVVPLVIKRDAAAIKPTIETITGRAGALYVIIDPFVTVNQVLINQLANQASLPTMHGLPNYVASGGLVSYGVSFEDQFRRGGDFVDKILKGAKAADLPVEQPLKFQMVFNLKTAQALNLTIPALLLAGADELIE